MDKMIELITKQIELLEEEITELRELMQNEVVKGSYLKDSKNDPDSIDIASFKAVFPAELSSTIDEILTYKGWFSSSSNESQIISAYSKLEKIIVDRLLEYNKEYVSIRDNKLKPKEAELSKYKDALDILNKCNTKNYVSPEELFQLDTIVDLLGASDELVNLYLEIAVKNIKILKEQKATKKEETTKALSNEQIQKMDEIRETINTSVEEIEERKTEREIIVERLTKFLNIEKKEKPSYIDVKKMIGPKLYSIIKSIIHDTKGIIDKKNMFDDSDYAVDFSVLREYIEMSGLDMSLEKDYFDAAVLVELLDACETQNVEKIKTTARIYKTRVDEDIRLLQEELAETERRAQEERELEAEIIEEENRARETINNFKPLPEFEEYAKYLKEVNDKYEIRNFLEVNKEYLGSLTGLSKSEIRSVFSTDDDYYKCCMSTCYKEISDILLARVNDSETKDELNRLKAELDSTIAEYEEHLNSKKTALDELRESGEPFNYIVLYDEIEFWESYASSRVDGARKKEDFPREVLECLNQLLKTTDVAEIKRNAHNVHLKRGKPNPYEILDFKFEGMRFTIKILPNAQVINDAENDKHNVIMVFHSVYGKRNKEDELMASLTTFKTKQARYKELQEIFGSNGNKEDQEREFRKGFAVVDKLKKELSGGFTL